MKKTRMMVLLAILLSQALVLSIVESWILLPIPIPGVKLGLANIITMIVIMFFGYREALLLVLLRTAISSIYGGGFLVFLFSVTGGVLSASVMAFLYKRLSKTFSTVGISVAGAITHNIGQLLIASLILKELLIITYLPILLIAGVITGLFVGFCSNILATALRKTKSFDI